MPLAEGIKVTFGGFHFCNLPILPERHRLTSDNQVWG